MSSSRKAIGNKQGVMNKREDKDGAADADAESSDKNPTKKRRTYKPVPFAHRKCELCGREIYTNPRGLAMHKNKVHPGWLRKEKAGTDHDAESSDKNPTTKKFKTGDAALLKCELCGLAWITNPRGLKIHKGIMHPERQRNEKAPARPSGSQSQKSAGKTPTSPKSTYTGVRIRSPTTEDRHLALDDDDDEE